MRPGAPLRALIETDRLSSIILWGPPGTGKTTLARLVAESSAKAFVPLSAVSAEGSATSIANRLRTNGPNFNIRKENAEQVLYAIRNGGFSGAIMPQNIVVGPNAQAVAAFLAQYSGRQAQKVPSTNITLSEK